MSSMVPVSVTNVRDRTVPPMSEPHKRGILLPVLSPQICVLSASELEVGFQPSHEPPINFESHAVGLSRPDINEQNHPQTTPTLPRNFSRGERLTEGVSGLQCPRVKRTMGFIQGRPRAHWIRRYPARLNPYLRGPGARVCPPVFPFRPWTG